MGLQAEAQARGCCRLNAHRRARSKVALGVEGRATELETVIASAASDEFDGIVMASVDPAALSSPCVQAEPRGTAVGVVGEGGIFRSRYLNGELTLGDRINAQDLVAGCGREPGQCMRRRGLPQAASVSYSDSMVRSAWLR